MKRKGKDRLTQRIASKRKISEMVWEFAGDFIRQGKNVQDRQNRLTTAGSAWNIAASQPERREKLLDGLMAQHVRFNPGTDPADLAAMRHDLEVLIARKLKMFPTDLRQIVNVRLMPGGEGERIEVILATLA